MKKKVIKVFFWVVAFCVIWSHLPYYYKNDRAADFITVHAEPKSKCSCAGYVMRAMWHGGCPIGLLPAYGYSRILPQMGFREMKAENYIPQKGDISVLPQNDRHVFGHIAVWNGNQWVSDFKQKDLYPSQRYKAVGNARICRNKDGWHWKHVWTSPMDWYGWVEAAVKGWKHIKL